jgi:hypothetical protein
MESNRKLLTTQVTSGRRNITTSKPSSTINAVTAYIFTDADGRKLVASSSMLDFTEASTTANDATITGVTNGTSDVIWENRTMTVNDGTIKDTWQPYAYHFYQLKMNDTGTKLALTVNNSSG